VLVDHSGARRDEPRASSSRSSDPRAERGTDPSSLAEGAVPFRNASLRELDRDREERIRLVIGARRGLLSRFKVGWAVFEFAAAAAILGALAFTVLATQDDSKSRSGTPVAAAHRSIGPPAEKLSTRVPKVERAQERTQAQRRAAIRAKHGAARRRVEQKPAKPDRAPIPQPSETQRSEPVQESVVPVEAEPQAPVPAPSPAPTRSPTPPSSSSSSPAQEEFGFEY
jgi:hypothetical protein